ncbi:hypothetical protein [Thermosphaera sp.]
MNVDGKWIKSENWQEIVGQVRGLREACYHALLREGPCTTRRLAAAMARTELSVRPRVTELMQLGLAECVGREGHEGIYRAIPLAEAAVAFERRRAAAGEQRLFAF